MNAAALATRSRAAKECRELELAQARAVAGDARRILSEERVELMARMQRHRSGQCSDVDLAERISAAAKVRATWSGY